jgi:multidrug resistance efflux pump
LQLAQAQALAGLRSAETNRDLAQAELKRYQELRQELRQCCRARCQGAGFKAAQANVDAAQAAYRGQSNQAGYARWWPMSMAW